jgi:hypothetical protein
VGICYHISRRNHINIKDKNKMKSTSKILVIVTILIILLTACDLTSGDVVTGLNAGMDKVDNAARQLDHATDKAFGDTSGCITWDLLYDIDNCPGDN